MWLGHQQGKTSTLGSQLVILIEFYIAPKDSRDLWQEVGVAQERLLRSGKCNKTQVGHSGHQSLVLISSHVEHADSARHWLCRDPSQHSNPSKGRFCKQIWTGTWEEIHFPVLTEGL